jgi:hypothetical protein
LERKIYSTLYAICWILCMMTATWLFAAQFMKQQDMRIAQLTEDKSKLLKQVQAYQLANQFSDEYGINKINERPGDALSVARMTERYYKKALREIAYRFNPGLDSITCNIIVNAIYREALEHEFNPLEIAAVMSVESKMHPRATSCVGARGLMQIMPGTGRLFASQAGVRWTGADVLYDPEKNVAIGVCYLAYLRRTYPNLYLVGYNGGDAAVFTVRRGNSHFSMKYKAWVANRYSSFRSLYARRNPSWLSVKKNIHGSKETQY